MLRIGLSPCFMYPDKSRAVFGAKSLSYAENDMIQYVTDHDCYPEIILNTPDKMFHQTMNSLDGIIFTGGSDVSPETYNEVHLNKEKWPGDKVRDDFEKKIFQKACELRIPIFAICRGFQLVNSLMGGSLVQDINSCMQTNIAHRDADKYDTIKHNVQFEKGSILAGIYGDQGVVNTVHHQCIKDLAKDLIAEGHCPDDGIVEAFRHKNMDEHFILGVQWHPEFSPTLKNEVLDHSKLFNYFKEHITKRTS